MYTKTTLLEKPLFVKEEQEPYECKGPEDGAAEKSEKAKEKPQDMDDILEPVRILIPYASLLSKKTSSPEVNRAQGFLFSLIEASAFIHQHQRKRLVKKEKDKEVIYVEANLEDYKQAYTVYMKHVEALLPVLTPQELEDKLKDKDKGEDPQA